MHALLLFVIFQDKFEDTNIVLIPLFSILFLVDVYGAERTTYFERQLFLCTNFQMLSLLGLVKTKRFKTT